MKSISFLFAVLLLRVSIAANAMDDLPDRTAKIFETHCLRCHNDDDKAGGITFSTNPSAQPDWNSQNFLELVTPVDGKAEMPKESAVLSQVELTTLSQWIESGAKWPDGLHLRPPRKLDLNWWSLQPLPSASDTAASLVLAQQQAKSSGMLQTDNPIDAFVIAQLAHAKLPNSPPASRRVLIRRLYYDLIGLPPTPRQIAEFEEDKDPAAYEKLVDSLLQSPRYGERWARHWLDIAHYADTHGYDKDKPRPNAWPYRDYVISSLNSDKPWRQFIQEQVAGDALFPNSVDGITALGFLSAGPWDFVGHAEVVESKIDGKIARHLDRDDIVRTVVQSFMGITIGCAQCHDHKFDPISQREYYQLQAVFSAIDRADKAYFDDPQLTQRFAELNSKRRSLDIQSSAIEDELSKAGGDRWKSITQRIKDANNKNLNEGEQFGYHSNLESKPDSPKWVQISLASPSKIDRIVLHPAFDQFNNIGADFGLPASMAMEYSNEPTGTRSSDAKQAIKYVPLSTWSKAEHPTRRPGQTIVIDCGGRELTELRIQVDGLAQRLPADYCFALAEVELIDASGTNVALNARVDSADSIEAPPRWRRTNIVDGKFPRESQTETTLAVLQQERESLRRELLGESRFVLSQSLGSDRADIEKQLAAFPKPKYVYAGTVHHGSGAFQGTGLAGGKPRDIFVLHRGEVTSPRERVDPAGLSLISNLSSQLAIDDLKIESQRRAALAKWLSSADNTFTWRSIVNRVWQYHFGTGLVDTPNDLGKMGGQPSHPQLLDWLAVEFRDQGQSLKSLHRLIVTSQTYRQSCDGPSEVDQRQLCVATDVENRLLWRGNRRRLDAEAVRDSILMLGGKLNLEMGGPGFEEFVLEKPEHSPHYRYDLLDFNNPATYRRSIYRFTVRSQLQPFLNTLDCADPSIQVATRNQGQSPLQALAMLNNGLIAVHSRHFADRLRNSLADETDLSLSRVIQHAFEEVTGRKPGEQQTTQLAEYARQHGLENLCRLLFNLSELSFVE